MYHAETHDSKEQKKKKRVLMDTLLDLYEQGGIDIEGIQEEINTFMFAGRSYLWVQERTVFTVGPGTHFYMGNSVA